MNGINFFLSEHVISFYVDYIRLLNKIYHTVSVNQHKTRHPKSDAESICISFNIMYTVQSGQIGMRCANCTDTDIKVVFVP